MINLKTPELPKERLELGNKEHYRILKIRELLPELKKKGIIFKV